MDNKPSSNPDVDDLACQTREASVTALQAAITKGLESGPPVVVDAKAFNSEMRQRYQKDINARGS